MKKIIAVSLILFMIIFAGCEQSGNVGKQPTSDPDTIKEFGSGNDTYTDVALTNFSTYEEYENYINKKTAEGKVPECFYTYDKLKEIGKFEGIVFLGQEGYFDSYMYTFKNKDEADLILYVYHTDNYTKMNYAPIPEKYAPTDETDVRQLGTDEELKGTYSYIHNDIRYVYINGEIYSIKWYSNGTYFGLNVSQLCEKTLKSGAFETKILNLNTARQTVIDIFGAIDPMKPDTAEVTGMVDDETDVFQ